MPSADERATYGEYSVLLKHVQRYPESNRQPNREGYLVIVHNIPRCAGAASENGYLAISRQDLDERPMLAVRLAPARICVNGDAGLSRRIPLPEQTRDRRRSRISGD
jgi:hypothetical protein